MLQSHTTPHSLGSPSVVPNTDSGETSQSTNLGSLSSFENTGRRDYSDGDALQRRSSLERQSHHSARFSTPHERSRARSDAMDQNRITARRRAMILEDRRRHFSEYRDSQTRRASSSTSIHPQYSPPPLSHDRGSAFHNRAPLSSVPGTSGSFLADINQRPLPRLPQGGDDAAHHPRLPRWQPDEDTSECPICGAAFTFWYRKHHCRKCGRVVCANCSPHRITIPKHYIVHPPDAIPIIPTTPATEDIEIVDLTGEEDQESSITGDSRRQSDHAIYGGQEVRLCNPCVPDPNPSPHMPYQMHSPTFSINHPQRHSYPLLNESSSNSNSNSRIWDSAMSALPAVYDRTAANQHHRDRQTRSDAGHNTYHPRNALASSHLRNESNSHDLALSRPNSGNSFGSLPNPTNTVSLKRVLRLYLAYTNIQAHSRTPSAAASSRSPIPSSAFVTRSVT